jgi:hypothetical protein
MRRPGAWPPWQRLNRPSNDADGVLLGLGGRRGQPTPIPITPACVPSVAPGIGEDGRGMPEPIRRPQPGRPTMVDSTVAVEPSSAVTEAGRKEVDWSSGEAEPREGGGIGPTHARPVVLPGRTGRTTGGDVVTTLMFNCVNDINYMN